MQRGYPFDIATQLKDPGAVTSTAAAQVGGSNKILDLRAARFEGTLVIDVSAIDFASTDETYQIEVGFSNDAAFGSGNIVGLLIPVTGTGRIEQPFFNEKLGTVYRYMRLRHILGGTTPSINYQAHAALKTC
ncbi:hypothetical protein [Xanthobacter flavus]|uniref:hypothetical protein n=1 Tax=Xanthobacter flavus TaxID=281 RepID=UPI00372B7E0C